ncbi:hypothetical protein FH972_022753 [Carpinus fangiana]|uniref:Glycosyl transferase CAP10 domain-containing protein n=1 Tax=Carpinus fangiana TaxID=176857 RepID=A0A5N6KVD6_9ROSI|nr:hypothetical protein FH972_022753 [Carpinus fangiana]
MHVGDEVNISTQHCYIILAPHPRNTIREMHVLAHVRLPENAYNGSMIPSVVLLGCCWAAFLITPVLHSLFVQALAAIILYAGISFHRKKDIIADSSACNSSWAAGLLLGLAQLFRRATGSGDSLAWIQIIVPLAVLYIYTVVRQSDIYPLPGERYSTRHLILAAVAAAVIIPLPISSATQASLGACLALVVSLAYVQLEQTFSATSVSSELSILDEKQYNPSNEAVSNTVVRNVALSMAATCSLGSYLFESFQTIDWQSSAYLAQLLLATGLNALMIALILYMISTSLDLTNILFGLLAIFCTVSSPDSLLVDFGVERSRFARFRILAVAAAALLFSGLCVSTFVDRQTRALHSFSGAVNTMMLSPGAAWQPMQLADNSVHPIEYLSSIAQDQYESSVKRQSRSLADAVLTYKDRYGVSPPPLFDRWYEFARKRNVDMIDEFDTVHDTLLPFWALKPATLRARVTEALGYEENGLIALIVRNGKVHRVEGGEVWQQDALSGLVENFVQFLPDLDIAFNHHDEPRIIVPHDELSRMIAEAQDKALPAALHQQSHRNEFSHRPKDMSDGDRAPEVKTSRFNEYAHQNTWIPSRLSCSPESPARDFRNVDELTPTADNTTSYALTDFGFIYNLTASTDVCTSPSFKSTHGFFDRPNAFKVAHELIPIFSESKVSSFQDILFPSMWHWNRQLPVERTANMHEQGMSKDMYRPSDNKLSWEEKKNALWWRGSTTGGWSVNGAWRHHHRQRLVRAINAPDRTKILLPTSSSQTSLDHNDSSSGSPWVATSINRRDLAHLFNVSFSGVGQCSQADCHAQEEFFNISPHAPMATSWNYRHLLDMDGNAFSARFYALLQSGGLVHKMQVFREWHDEWVRPWVHYVPLSLGGGEWAESLRFLSQEGAKRGSGEQIARGIADRGRAWVQEGGGRREAMETWMFRLLLEYARVVDDEREAIGYDG